MAKGKAHIFIYVQLVSALILEAFRIIIITSSITSAISSICIGIFILKFYNIFYIFLYNYIAEDIYKYISF